MDKTVLYGEVLDSLNIGVYFADKNMKASIWSKAARDITGYDIADLPDQTCEGSLLCRADMTGAPLCAGGCPVKAAIGDGAEREALLYITKKGGDLARVKAAIKPIFDGGLIIGSSAVLCMAEGDAEGGAIADPQKKPALTDKLTGLYNRGYFEEEIRGKLAHMPDDGSQYCLVFLDIDNFGRFNNIYGHEAGDIVLKEMAHAVTGNVRKTDTFCRWGGEEFVGIFQINAVDYLSGLAITSLGNKLLKSIRDVRVQHNNEELGVTASLGLTFIRASDTAERAINRADELMYRSKATGKNKYTVG